MRGACQEPFHRSGGLVHQAQCGTSFPVRRNAQIRESYRNRSFYTYYQIGGEDEPDEAETEPGSDGELKSRYRGSHSPFGFVWQIADATGWSVRYILYGVSYQMLIMMLSDAPRYVGGKKSKTNTNTTAEDEAAEVANFFRSNLKA